ncbi:MAG: hypothetical protein IPP29_19365 [Bacteroidetes bacterium]|nr:hypothetical protein [Bacteroidota bacterium]
MANGFAEALKHALIYDKNLWQKIKKYFSARFFCKCKNDRTLHKNKMRNSKG